RKTYAADRIVNELSRLHDRFYPQPITMTKTGPERTNIADNEIDHLSKEALVRLYVKCGSVLHRGTLASTLAREEIERDWIVFVKAQTQRIANLLGQHAVIMKGDARAVFANLKTGQVMIANAV